MSQKSGPEAPELQRWASAFPLLRYKYFDTPDGEDCPKKLFYLAKYGTVFGASWAGLRLYCFQEDPTTFLKAKRFLTTFWPIPTAYIGYGAVTCISTTLRGKDDPWNHGFGGFVGTYTVAAAMRPAGPGLATCYGVLGGLIAMFYKAVYVENRDERFLGPRTGTGRYKCSQEHPHDFTIVDERAHRKHTQIHQF